MISGADTQQAASDGAAAAPAQTEQAAAPKAPAAPAAPAQPETPAKPAQVAQAPAASNIDGEKVYRGICFSCHDSGVANSPKPGDKAAWEPRIAAGIDALYNSVLQGKGHAGQRRQSALSDDEIKAAVDWMVAQ
ncbi:MAG: c-type cytochrome [Thiolinea sp.]